MSSESANATLKSPRSERSDIRVSRSDIGILRLNERDKELILLLFDNQAMSRGQIETRFFGSTPRCNSRLKKLLNAGYLSRHTATDLPGMSLQGLQAIYTPGKASFPLIALAKDLPLSEVRKLCRSDCTPLYLTHALHAAHFRQLVESGFSQKANALSHQNASLTWKLDLYLGEQECRHEYDVRVGEGWQREVFRPDGFFRAVNKDENVSRSFFIEIDLGHTGQAEFSRKIAVHQRYRESGLFREVFGEDDFSTLVITTTKKRQENLIGLLQGQRADFVILSTLQEIETGVLKPIWRKIIQKDEAIALVDADNNVLDVDNNPLADGNEESKRNVGTMKGAVGAIYETLL
jgi:hypothetical protein